MAGLIPREFINDLLLRVDIVDLIDSHVPLKKAGSNYMARCPFHTEKSPSFSVNRNKQFYHCFGCGVSGNAISFLMEFSHLTFVEAVEEIASFVGVEVPRESGAVSKIVKDNLKDLYQLSEQVAKFYAQQLRAANPNAQNAIAYLKNRGLTGEIAKEFMLGFAPEQWDFLLQRFPAKTLLDAGLVVKNEKGKQYDRFRGRIMFPIRDKRGRIIGFGGRVLDDSQPKYLNSPETPIFSKGQNVYGLYELLKKNSKPERILIVEGYMDVIALAQYGISYAVATLGTATTKAHLDLLFRHSHELVFCFDGDKAGQQAAWRATEMIMPPKSNNKQKDTSNEEEKHLFAILESLQDGRQIRIMLLPEGHDPDSLIRVEGLTNFEQRISSAQIFSDYFFNYLTAKLDLSTMEGRAKLVADTKPLIDKLPESVFKQLMEEKLRQLSFMPALTFAENIVSEKPKTDKAHVKAKKTLSPARVAIALLLQNPHLADKVIDKISHWEMLEYPGLDMLKKLLDTIITYHPANTGALVEMYRGMNEEKIINRLLRLEFPIPETGIATEFSDAVDKLITQAIAAKRVQLLEKEKRQGLSDTEKEHLKNLFKTNII